MGPALKFHVMAILLIFGQCVHGGMSVDGILENYDANNPQNVFNDASVTQNEEHMKEHLQEEINIDPSKMTQEQLEFHYFRIHDANGDSKLDGLEILKALQHKTPQDKMDLVLKMGTEGKTDEEKRQMASDKMTKINEMYCNSIDKMMEEDDKDLDGYLTYPEFASARRRQQAKYNEAMQKIQQMNPQKLQQMQNQVLQLQQQMLAQQQPQQMQNLQTQVKQLNEQIAQNPDILKKVQQMVQNPEQMKLLQQAMSSDSGSLQEQLAQGAEQMQKIQKLLELQKQ